MKKSPLMLAASISIHLHLREPDCFDKLEIKDNDANRITSKKSHKKTTIFDRLEQSRRDKF